MRVGWMANTRPPNFLMRLDIHQFARERGAFLDEGEASLGLVAHQAFNGA